MPRRDELSEEKRKRLMQEQEQLQKLMLQARSSVRRSSMKDVDAKYETLSDRITAMPPETKEEYNTPVEQQKEESVPQKKPLTEKEIFPTEAPMNTVQQEPAPLTERELFEETKTTSTEPLQKNRTVNIILPNQITTAPVVQSRVERRETVATPQEETPQETPETQEENTYSDDEVQQPERSKNRAVVLVLIAVLLVAFGGYYLYESNQKHNTTMATRNSAPVSVVPTPQTQSQLDTTQVQRTNANANKTTQENTSNEKTAAKTQDTQKPLSEELKSFDNVTVAKTPETTKPQAAQTHKDEEPQTTPNANLGKYEVISKAYFHNEPDESTRRKAFMTHWDNAVLTPLDERNDFIYVVFTNHLGQTSKGWLRKSDLKRIE